MLRTLLNPSRKICITFELLKVRPEIVKALKEHGITAPTLIQQKAIPLIKSGKDVIGMSKTGSGKTAAFGIPILERTVPGRGVQVLIISPTRELAHQIAQELAKFGRYMRCSIATIYGGVSIEPQINHIKHADIIVGTPGRLLDHLQRRTLNLSKLNCFVLDEADKLVDMGFIDDIKRILDQTPKNKQILLFGATISDEIHHIRQRYMNNPEIAQAESHVKEEYLEQYYYNVQPHDKFSLLVHLLKKESINKAIIFCSTISTVNIIAKNLKNQGIRADMLHGHLRQNQRQRVLESFHRDRSDILVASAVAARGLDIREVTHVFNYDLPRDPQEYIHRIGRTARAGDRGKAITLLSHKDYDAFRAIQARYRINVEELHADDFPRLRFEARAHSDRGGDRNFRRGPRRFGSGGGRGSGGGGRQHSSSGHSRWV